MLDSVSGSFVGGICGAVVGAIGGVLAGALVVDKLATPSRRLTTDEIRYAREVFADSLDYSPIRITRNSLISTGAPKVVGNTIHLRAVWGADQFARDARGEFMEELTAAGREMLIHELVHVWQHQNGGLAYIPDSLAAQLMATLKQGSRGGAYAWRPMHRAGLPWAAWNPEQQAALVEDYNRALRRVQEASRRGQKPAGGDQDLLMLARPYIDLLRRRSGAPGWRPKHGVGAGLGALAGAGLGALLGGPVGAVFGGMGAGLLSLFAGSLYSGPGPQPRH